MSKTNDCPFCGKTHRDGTRLSKHLFFAHRVMKSKVGDAGKSYPIRSRQGEGWDAIVEGKTAATGFDSREEAQAWLDTQ